MLEELEGRRKGFGGGGGGPGASSSSSESDGEGRHRERSEESEGRDDALSDISEDYDVFKVSALADATWRTLEDEDDLVARIIKGHLRPEPLRPPALDDLLQSWDRMDIGEAISRFALRL